MPLPTLPTPAWRGTFPSPDALPGVVLWIGGEALPFPALEPLRAGLHTERRLWTPALRLVTVDRPGDQRNPWAWRPGHHPPIRWEGEHTELADVPSRPKVIDAVILDGALCGRGDFEARRILVAAATVATIDRPWFMVEPNGQAARESLRLLRTSADRRGEGGATLRSAAELRRLLETCGFGLNGAWAWVGPSKRQRLVSAVLGPGLGAGWLVLRGRTLGPPRTPDPGGLRAESTAGR